MKLFLDDIRNPPDASWHVSRTARDAIKQLATGKVTEISFDHDLGDTSEMNGNDVASWIEWAVHEKKINLPKWRVHSMNPVGKRNIEKTMASAERFANR